tara:strand:+ start:6406 stop:6573 length:168 start_codon:yes stop_codon:yes gene_type:complete
MDLIAPFFADIYGVFRNNKKIVITIRMVVFSGARSKKNNPATRNQSVHRIFDDCQ